jgi:GNAT superfamily N-acetyltransferase
VLIDAEGHIAGYFTVATGQVDFGDLPVEISKRLPRRSLPVAVLAWLGVDLAHQRQGLGKRLLAQALRDCYEAGQTFAFVGVTARPVAGTKLRVTTDTGRRVLIPPIPMNANKRLSVCYSADN